MQQIVRAHPSCAWPFDGRSSLALRNSKKGVGRCIVPALSGSKGRAELRETQALTVQTRTETRGGESIFEIHFPCGLVREPGAAVFPLLVSGHLLLCTTYYSSSGILLHRN